MVNCEKQTNNCVYLYFQEENRCDQFLSTHFILIYLNYHDLFMIKDKKTHLDSNSTAQYLSNDTKHDIS